MRIVNDNLRRRRARADSAREKARAAHGKQHRPFAARQCAGGY